MISFPFCSPVTEATKPAQQLSTPSTSGDINVTVLITNLLSGYDKRLRPNFGGEEKNLCLLFFFWSRILLCVIWARDSSMVCLACNLPHLQPLMSRHAILLDTPCVTTRTTTTIGGDCFANGTFFSVGMSHAFATFNAFDSVFILLFKLQDKILFFPILGEPVSVSVTVFIEFIGDIDEINMVWLFSSSTAYYMIELSHIYYTIKS